MTSTVGARRRHGRRAREWYSAAPVTGEMQGRMDGFDQQAFRAVMGQFCTGVVVATGMDAEGPAGFAAQSFLSLSLEPPLVALSPARTSRSWPRLRDAGHFCINVLGADQRPICDGFARSGTDKFEGVAWAAGRTGAPVLEGVLAAIECELVAEHDAGDHTLAVGRVLALHQGEGEGDRGPLLFFRGGYGSFEGS